MVDPNKLINKVCTDCGMDYLIARKVRKCPECGHPLVKDPVLEEMKMEKKRLLERGRPLPDYLSGI